MRLFLLVMFLSGFALAPSASARNPKCISLEQVKPSDNLWDILYARFTCVEYDDYDFDRAADLEILGKAYFAFDMARLKNGADEKKLQELLEEQNSEIESENMMRLLDHVRMKFADPTHFDALCNKLKALGPPTYPVDYASDDVDYEPEENNIDPTAEWAKALNENVVAEANQKLRCK